MKRTKSFVLAMVVTLIAASWALGATQGGSVVGWGYNEYGIADPPAGSNFVAIAAGKYHSLVLKADGTIVGWGLDHLGIADPPTGSDFVAIAAGEWHSVALKADGTIVCWGDFDWGKTQPPGGNDYVAIAAGYDHSLALKADGTIVSWGYYGCVDPPDGNDYVAIAAGDCYSLALKADGTIVGSGTDPPTGSNFVAIAAGYKHSLALKADSTIVGWGDNRDGQANSPAGSDFVAISAGRFHSVALKADGTIVGWGYNVYGQANSPAGSDFVAISAGQYHNLALVGEASLQGIVHDQVTGEPIEGADVNVPGQPLKQTDQFGKFSFFDLPAGQTTVTVTKDGYYPVVETATISENSIRFVNIIMIPQVSGTQPAVVQIQGKYCGLGKHCYYLNGVSLSETFTVTVDWKGYTPGSVRWITSTNTYEDACPGTTVSRSFDMGSEFSLGGKLTVVAIAGDLTQSSSKQANFSVIAPPLGIAIGLLQADTSGNEISYNAEWLLGAINEGVGDSVIDSGIPGFGDRAFEFVIEPLIEARIMSDGSASASIASGYELPPMAIAGVGINSSATVSLSWQYSSEQQQWLPIGQIQIDVAGDYASPANQYVIMVGPVPVPVYWRTALETALGVQLALTGWYPDGSSIWQGNIPFDIAAEIMLGVGVSDVLAAEGYLGGGANMQLEFPNEDPLQQLSIELNGGIRLIALIFKYENNLLHYEWYLVGGVSAMMIPMALGIPKTSEFEVMERSYLSQNYAVWAPSISQQKKQNLMMLESTTMEVADPNEEQLLQYNVFSQSQPTIAGDGNDLFLAWIYDDPNRDPGDNASVNRTEVVFAKCTDDVWSQPVVIDDDSTADFSPVIASFQTGDALCVWENAKQELPNDVNLADMAAVMEIEAGHYGNSSGTWTVKTLTNNAHLDRSPRVATANNNTGLALWIYNNKDDILGEDPNALNEIEYSTWNGSRWIKAKTAATGLKVIVKSSLDYNGSEAIYVFTVDVDGDTQTETDRELYAITYDGASWSEPNQLTNDVLLDANPQIIYDGSDTLMVWYRDANLVSCRNSDVNNLQEVLLTSGSSGSMDFRLAKNPSGQISLVWTENSPQGIDIFTATYDSQLSIWSKAYQLTSDPNMERSVTATYVGSNELALAYNKVQIVDNNGIPEPNRVDLYILRHQIKGDLAVSASDISLSVANPLPGSTVDVNAIIHNLGDIAEVNIPVAFYNGDPNNGGVPLDNIQIIPGPIPAGDSDIATASWSVPAANEPQQIYVVIDPNFEIEEANRNNNIAFTSVMTPDLTVTSISSERIGPKMRGIIAKIKNVGSLAAENISVSLRKEAGDGEQIASFNISALDPNSSYDTWHEWDITAQDFNDVEVALYVVADVNNTISELNEDDNTAFGSVQVGKVADVTDNGRIDFTDFAKLANNWLDSCVAPEWCEACDFNQSNQVNWADLKKLCDNWLWQASWYSE